MLKRIIGIIKKDWAYTRQENILVYMIMMPLVLALIFRIFVPSMEKMELTFAVDSSVPTPIVNGLNDFGRVEVYSGYAALEERVLQLDDVPGIYLIDGQYRVLLEGNEQSYVRDLPGSLLDFIMYNRNFVETTYVSRGVTGSQVREISAILLVYMGIQIGGLSIGLSIVNERESKAMRALAVSPVNTAEYIIGKSLLAIVLGTMLAVGASLIFVGTSINYMHLVGATLSGAILAILIGFVLGILSDNQITAIAVVKALFLVIIGVPLGSLFLPKSAIWLAYPFPNYWAFVALRQVFGVTDYSTLLANSLSFGISLALLLVLTSQIRHRFKLG